MDDFFRNLLSTDGFVARRSCGLWSDGHIWLHTLSDLLIWLAYLSIPLILGFFLWSRRASLPFRGLIALFAAFIFCCGTTHLLDALMFDWPAYRLSGLMKGLTAAVSWLTVAALVPAVPRVLQFLDDAIPSSGARLDQPGDLGRPQRYMIAAGLAGLSLLARFGLDLTVGEERGYLLPLVAVMAAAGYGGFGPGMVAVLLGGVGYTALFVDLNGAVGIASQSNAALFVFCGLVASTLGQSQRSARLAAEAATADLHESNRQLARSQWDTVEALTQLDAFLTHAPVGLAFYNPDLEPVRVNKYLRGASDAATGQPAFSADTLAAFRQVLDTGTPLRDQTMPGLSGPDSVWQVSAFPARDPYGVTVGLAMVAQDVTERVNQERAVAASEARFRQLADAMPQIVYVARPDGTPEYLNRRWYEYTGLADNTQASIQAAIHPDDRPRIAERYAAVAGGDFEIEFRMRRAADGAYRWFLTRSTPIRNDAGVVVSRYGTSTDIDDQKRTEDAVRQAGDLLRQITDTVPAFIALVGPDRRYQLVNRAYEEQFGRPREELVGRPVREVLGETAWAASGPRLDRAFAGEVIAFETELTDPAGAARSLITTYTPKRDAVGAVQGVVVSALDVTERQRAEVAARAAEERFAFVRRSSGVGFWYCDLPFDVLEWDERVKDHFHLSPDATVTIDTFYARIHPDDREPTRRAIEGSIGDHTGYDTVYRTVHPDTGAVKWLRAVGRTAYGPDGTPTQFDGITIDVTAAKRAEQALRESEANSRLALDVARLGTWQWWPGEDRVEADARGCAILGWPPAGALTLDQIGPTLHPDDRELVEAARRQGLDPAGDGRYAVEHRMVHPDGTVRWVAGRGQTEFQDGAAVLVRGTVQDITDRKAAEAALRESEERRRLALDAAELGSWNIDMATGAMQTDERFRLIFTGSAGPLDYDQALDGIHPDDRDRIQEAVAAATRPADPAPYAEEYRVIHPDGATRWVFAKGRAKFEQVGSERRVVSFDGTVADVTDRKRAEQALAASEARFRGLADTAPQIIWEADHTGRTTYASRYQAEYTGRPSTGDVDAEWRANIRPDHVARVAANWADAVAGKAPYHDLYPVRRKDGAFRWFQTSGRLVRHPDGSPDRWVGTSTDVHDRVAAEEALAATQRTLTLALATANAGVFTWDVAADRFTLRLADPANPGALGVSRPQTYAQTMATIHPDDRERVRAAVERCRADRGPFAETYRVGGRDAGWRWLEGRGQFEYAADGRPLRMVGVRMDVHDRKTAEEAARRADREFRAMADSIPQLAWMTQPDGFIDWYNSRWYEYTGTTFEQMRGWGWQAVHDPAEVGRVTEKFKYHIETGVPWEDTFPLRGADGQFRWFLSRARPIRDEAGQVVRWFGTNTDVTAQRQLEADLRAVGERFRFLDRLGQATREADARATLATTARLLGEHLHATRCAYADVLADGDAFAVRHDWTDGAESVVGDHSLALFGPRAVADMRAGRPLVIRDVDAELVPADGGDTFNAFGIKAIVCCPLVKSGRLTAMIAVHQAAPRDWTPAEVSLINEVVERTWAHGERARAEDEAREAAVRFRTLSESVPALVWSCDATGYTDYHSSRWAEYTGRPQADMADGGWAESVHPDDRAATVAAWDEAFPVGRPFAVEYRLRRHDGVYRWQLAQALPQRDAGGRVVRWYGTVTDIDDQKAQERELRQKSAILDTINNHTPTLVFVKDRASRAVMYNPATLKVLGRTEAEVLGRTEAEYLAADAAAVLLANDRRVMETGEVLVAEEKPDLASDATYLSIKAPHRGADGRVVGLIGVSVDITAQKRLERELRAASDRFRTLTEAIPQLVFNADADGRVTYFNTRWKQYTGLAQPDALANWWPQVMHPADGPALEASWRRAMRDRAEPFSHEVRLRRASDGAYRWHLTAVVPLRSPAGEVDQWIGSLSDIHDLKTAEETIRASEMRFRQLVEAVPNLVWVTDADGRITQLNRQWVGYTGRQLDDILGDGWTTLLHQDDAPGVLAGWQAAVRHRAPYTGEYRFRTADGSYRWQLARGIPVAGADGRLSQWFGTTTDIDNQKRAAELLEAQVRERTAELARSNGELEKFAYVASHDLQEPLRKVQAFGDRLAKKFAPGLGADGKDYIQRMQDSAARMQTLIQDLLTFSRVSTKPRAFVLVPLGPLVDGVLSDLEALTTRTGATVQVGDLPTVSGDPGQLRQVFQNLVANACKFHKPGQPPSVTLAAERLDVLPADADPPPGLPAGWRLTVSDDGIGFEQQYADKIFEVFQRLHGRGTYEGTGIGLAICRKVVERHGGIITARGRPGEGAVFVVDLPAPRETPRCDGEDDERPADHHFDGRRRPGRPGADS